MEVLPSSPAPGECLTLFLIFSAVKLTWLKTNGFTALMVYDGFMMVFYDTFTMVSRWLGGCENPSWANNQSISAGDC